GRAREGVVRDVQVRNGSSPVANVDAVVVGRLERVAGDGHNTRHVGGRAVEHGVQRNVRVINGVGCAGVGNRAVDEGEVRDTGGADTVVRRVLNLQRGERDVLGAGERDADVGNVLNGAAGSIVRPVAGDGKAAAAAGGVQHDPARGAIGRDARER